MTRAQQATADVFLTAVPDQGWQFDHWEGYPSGSQNPYAISIGGDTVPVAAVFQPAPCQFELCGICIIPAGLVSFLGLVGMKRRLRRRTGCRRRR